MKRLSDKDLPRTVHLVDASPYVFRGFHSIPATLRTPRGEPANAVYGFAQFLLRLAQEESPTHLAVTFDGSLTTSFRNDLFPGYKAHRAPPPGELAAQLGACRRLAAALGMATFVDERYEADDLIATLAAGLLAAGHGAVVVSSDKDLTQLVGERVTFFDFARGERYDAAGVREKFGVRPDQIVDLLALAGDPVDAIPGVAGVGRKTAVALLAALGDLDAVYADLDRVGALPLRGAGALARRLAAHREDAFLSRRLATVARDAPASAGLDDLAWRGAVAAELDPLLEELGFRGLRQRVPRWAPDG